MTARLPNHREQLIRWVRLHPAASGTLATAVLAILLVVGTLIHANQQQARSIAQTTSMNRELGKANNSLQRALSTADQLRGEAERMRQEVELQWEVTQENLYVSEVRRAFQVWNQRDLPNLRRIVDPLNQSKFDRVRGIECGWLRHRLDHPFREITDFPRAAYAAAFSPSGHLLAAAGQDSIVRLISYSDPPAVVAEWPTQQSEINGLAFSPDGTLLWTSGDDGSLCQRQVETGVELQRVAAYGSEQAHDLIVIAARNQLLSTGTD